MLAIFNTLVVAFTSMGLGVLIEYRWRIVDRTTIWAAIKLDQIMK